ncbi:hypothetical protein [Pseudomonas fluorescens]|uniref:hypothetical protein n=1 Tax=Pseudomonas fluorescens TaxID=294 RepID=UPI001249765F|nr:hypothetical protein [Pseudomonas fluorescens]CAG8864061.1 hypothetical protein PS861_00160 [Pseudomonas fluorescens]
MKYYILKYSDDLPEGFGATTQGPFVKVRPKYQDDVGLIEHEKTHVRQWYALMGLGLVIIGALMVLAWPAFWPAGAVAPFLHPLLYKFVRPYRRWCEVGAYRKQVEVGGYVSTEFAVTALAEKYDLDLDPRKASELLTE